MSLIFSLLITISFALLFNKLLRKNPIVFYAVALLISAAGIYFTWNPSSLEIVRTVAYAVQKGHLGFSLFALVMFIGVLNQESKIRRMLTPIRAHLSIMGSIFIVGHFIPYLRSYLGMLETLLSLRVTILFSIVIAMILLVLLMLLTITSFDAVKRRVDARNWKSIQKLAYFFFVFVFMHLIGYLIIPALSGSPSALINCAVYGVILVLYIILRVRRSLLDRALEQELNRSFEPASCKE